MISERIVPKPKLLIWDVKIILGLKILIDVEFLNKAGIEICPSPSRRPVK